jgi:hypothetical protein
MTSEAVRKEWRASPRTCLDWTPLEDQAGNDAGECKGEFCTAAGFPHQAYVKPGKIGKLTWGWPLPAFEKIAADFAYDLQCPVPMAQVWETDQEPAEDPKASGAAPKSVPDEYPFYRCVSLREFPQRFAWNLVQSACQAVAAEPIKAITSAALARASGMLVLDTWIGQSDRGDHPTNVQLGYDPDQPGRTQLLYLDFGRTLNWNGQWDDEGWKKVGLAAQPALIMKTLDKKLVTETYDKLLSIAPDDIREVCFRLAGAYFPERQAAAIAEALIGRRDLLRPLLAPHMIP